MNQMPDQAAKDALLREAVMEDIRCHRENGVSLNPYSTVGARGSWQRGFDDAPMLLGGHAECYARGQLAAKLIKEQDV